MTMPFLFWKVVVTAMAAIAVGKGVEVAIDSATKMRRAIAVPTSEQIRFDVARRAVVVWSFSKAEGG
jgi:hypothetical protein